MNRIHIEMRSPGKPLTDFYCFKKAPLLKLKKAYAEIHMLSLSRLIFRLEGVLVEDHATASSLSLRNYAVIDVTILKEDIIRGTISDLCRLN